MKIPTLLVRKKKKKTLRASTARRSMAVPEEMDYEEMSEPNMKLSRALLIVLVLHVVAVAGIIAFNTIKSRQGAFPQRSTAAAPARTETISAPAESAAPALPQQSAMPQAKPAGTVGKATPGLEQIKHALPVNESVDEAGKFYVVAKGDNPVSIAKKLKVSQSELLAVNHIDDPRKLQIGQKLIVPASKTAKTEKKKKANEN